MSHPEGHRESVLCPVADEELMLAMRAVEEHNQDEVTNRKSIIDALVWDEEITIAERNAIRKLINDRARQLGE